MKLRAGQNIWYIDHFRDEIREGVLISPVNASGRDEHPTLNVAYKYGKQRILEDWVFATKEKAHAGLRKKIRYDIQEHKREIIRLTKKL